MRLAALWTVEVTLNKYYFEKYPGKFMLLQYEHLALYPFDVTQQVYEFLGYPIADDSVLKWLSASIMEGTDDDRYGTNRDSEQMASIWENRLTQEGVYDIEELAGDLMDFFNYPRKETGYLRRLST